MKKTSEKQPEATKSEPYHHGDLRAALIKAADDILAEEGLEGFSLRAAARRAGVSVSAPAHHFNSAAGLLSEVAALGFNELAKHLEITSNSLTVPQRLRSQSLSYVRFAMSYPGRFQLMFRRDLLDMDHAGLHEAGGKALGQLEHTIRLKYDISNERPLTPEAHSNMLAAWSLVHGFAHLLLGGKLANMFENATQEELFKKALPDMLINQWPD